MDNLDTRDRSFESPKGKPGKPLCEPKTRKTPHTPRASQSQSQTMQAMQDTPGSVLAEHTKHIAQTESKYHGMTKKELQFECKQRGLRSGATLKEFLVGRLMADDEARGFRNKETAVASSSSGHNENVEKGENDEDDEVANAEFPQEPERKKYKSYLDACKTTESECSDDEEATYASEYWEIRRRQADASWRIARETNKFR